MKLIIDFIFKELKINSNLDLEANKANKSFKSKNKSSFYKYYKLKGHLEEKC